jgi:putative ABC transport system permease protein
MLKNYLKVIIRNLWKNKTFSIINVFGLSLGLSVCILIVLFVRYEKSYDSFNTKNIYRLDEVQSWEGMVEPQKVALSMAQMGPTLVKDFPEIKSFARFTPYGDPSLRYKDNKIFFKTFLWADSTFLQLFNYKLLQGDAKEALRKPNTIVLTEESARKLFGNDNPMGKTVPTNNRMDTMYFTVTGILENIPENSHLQFDGLCSMSSLERFGWLNSWGSNMMCTYLELDRNADIKKLEAKFPAYIEKYMDKKSTEGYKLFLQSLQDVHSDSSDITHDYYNDKKFDRKYTNVFMMIAFVVLIIGCINFINLSTARSITRAREVGVRKSIGAFRTQIILQFISESVLLALISTILAVLLAKLAIPFVNALSKHDLNFSVIDPLNILFIFGGAILVGIVSGVYPAFYLSSFEPVKVLKGNMGPVNSKSATRNILVTLQFACAAFLIIATIFGLKQLNFMLTKDPGFSSDQVVMLPGAYKNYYKIKTELQRSTLVKGVSGSTQRLGNNLHQTGMMFYGDGPEKNLATSHVLVDHEFVKLFQIKILAGKDFTQEGIGKEYMVNEAMAKKLLESDTVKSYESLIGKKISLYGDTAGTLVGVVQDFNFNSMHHTIETLCIYNKKPWGFHDVCVKIDGRRTKEALAYIQETWQRVIPHFPFSYQFLDEHFAQLYEADKKVSEVVGILASLAILVACLGLFGLALYTAERRIKEIGIRKVMGASVNNIIRLLSGDFIKLVVIANIIAWPVAWMVVSRWLQNYAYRIDLNAWVFIVSGLASICIALLTISLLTYKAAQANPVKSLRTE